MMTDPISDMLTRIRNAVAIEAPSVDIPYSKLKHEICKVLVTEGYVLQFEVLERQPQNALRVQLKYGLDGEKIIQSIRRISKPGKRVYSGAKRLRPVLGGMGVRILSTSRGIMSDRQARAQKVGGEVLCEIY
jgi:small subunit ribosomal protein S8